VRDGAALRGMLALRLDGNRVAAEHVQLAFRECLLIELSAFGRGGNGIVHARVCDSGFGVVRDELIAVCPHPDARETRFLLHRRPSALARELGEWNSAVSQRPGSGVARILSCYRMVGSHSISASITYTVDIHYPRE